MTFIFTPVFELTYQFHILLPLIALDLYPSQTSADECEPPKHFLQLTHVSQRSYFADCE